ncbi:MAG TPA: hypothetical protein VHR37_04680, partial [Solirubrobacterales bacterium]|nr:hypothetical protein [Solirubrobacterales bacterium]
MFSHSDDKPPSTADSAVRRAGPADAGAIGRLLHDFNEEFEEPSPGPQAVADRVRALMGSGDFAVLLVGSEPNGLAVLRFRPSIYSSALECNLAELYVKPDHRGQGLG